MKQEHIEEVATSTPDIELLQKVNDLEQQLSKLKEHSDSTIKLLKKKNERLKKQLSSTMSEYLPSTVSDSHPLTMSESLPLTVLKSLSSTVSEYLPSTVSVKPELQDEVEMEIGDTGPSTVSPVSNGEYCNNY